MTSFGNVISIFGIFCCLLSGVKRNSVDRNPNLSRQPGLRTGGYYHQQGYQGRISSTKKRNIIVTADSLRSWGYKKVSYRPFPDSGDMNEANTGPRLINACSARDSVKQ
jgi:hypothetical protein